MPPRQVKRFLLSGSYRSPPEDYLRHLSCLTPRYRHVFMQTWHDMETDTSLAKKMGLSPARIWQIRHRAYDKLWKQKRKGQFYYFWDWHDVPLAEDT